jgi:hypothetical protein
MKFKALAMSVAAALATAVASSAFAATTIFSTNLAGAGEPVAVPGTGNASVALGFTPLPAVTTGTYNNVFALTPSAFDAMLAGALAGIAYVNIHTPGTYGGGEIRGFLQAAVVPEPGSYALMLAGLAALGWAVRKRNAA